MSNWWQEAVGYQIYPRSFKDSNSDGIGDINGIREKLTYLKELGIDFIWLTPVYQSPNVDNGYDISDYCEISEDFGTMAEFQSLVKEAKALNIKIVMDLVINHTSNQHQWFEKSREGSDDEYSDFYIWHKPVKGKEPNDWQSIFGGSVWTFDEKRGEYYFHAFAKEQPDLNWESEAMKKKVFEMIEWWIAQGVDGFRIDAISHIKKAPWNKKINPKNNSSNYQNVPGIGKYLTELSDLLKKNNVFSVGEASGVVSTEAETWVGKDGYFSMIFEFEHLGLWRESNEESSFEKFKDALIRWQDACAGGKGWNALYNENHDVPRSVSVYGDDSQEYRTISAKALALTFMLLEGTPFIYQGQEIGMTNAEFTSIDQIDATDTISMYQRLLKEGDTPQEAMAKIAPIARDNARTPMQWDASEFAGFSDVPTWLGVNANKDWINVELEKNDPNSVYHFYKALIELRKNHRVFIDGTFKNIDMESDPVFCYERKNGEEHYVVVINLSGESQVVVDLKTLAENELVLANYQDAPSEKLRPYEARVYKMLD